jgi:hypothetical protein
VTLEYTPIPGPSRCTMSTPSDQPIVLKTCASPFQLLHRLPPELRVEIYKHLFRDRTCAALTNRRRLCRAVEARFSQPYVCSILQTCRLFRLEAVILFRQLVTIAFSKHDIPAAGVELSDTVLDLSQLHNAAVVGPNSDICLSTYMKTNCPKLNFLRLRMHHVLSSWWEPLHTVIDKRDVDPVKLQKKPMRLGKVLLSTTRKEWLCNSRVAEISEEVAQADDRGLEFAMEAHVAFEQALHVPLEPDCDGGVGPFLPMRGAVLRLEQIISLNPRGKIIE